MTALLLGFAALLSLLIYIIVKAFREAMRLSTGSVGSRLAIVGVVLCLVNFIAFFLIAIFIGGDAVNGFFRDGHYFLVQHGHKTEVTQSVYTYSLWHSRSLFITHPLGALCFLYLSWNKKRTS